MIQLFNLNSDADKKIVEHHIDYLINNKLIKKITLTVKLLKFAKIIFYRNYCE